VILLDGQAVAAAMRCELFQQVHSLQISSGQYPHLAVMLIGHDPASHTYVNAKLKACRAVGFRTTFIQHAAIQEADLLQQIGQINNDPTIDGLIVQLPLPRHISVQKVIHHMKPEKDVDGFHAFNYGCMARNLPSHVPATSLGILTLLAHYQLETSGKHCVIVGRSRTVGAPHESRQLSR
jgi:methylenetetrahydrofolate dehydrogenase (NADP+) / methenyltetrahydrofolate cyclohydrolase